MLGLSAQAWVAILLAAWLVTALLLGILVGRMIRLSRKRDTEHEARVLAENDNRKLLDAQSARPAYTGPRGAHHADTSQLPAVRADLGEAAATGPVPQVPGAWTEEVHPGRRAADRGSPAPPPLPPGQPGGRRRSDTRQTRAQARLLRDGEDLLPPDATTPPAP
jgi:hypothetical protein